MNLDPLRSFLLIAETKSLNRAAEKLHVSQSTLTRQIRTLENDIGGALLERSHTGVALTAAGHALRNELASLLPKFDAAIAQARTIARGQSEQLRLGYLLSAAPKFLNPSLAALRRQFPKTKVSLHDLSPGEQVAALRNGTIDIGLLGSPHAYLEREFYVKNIATLPIIVVLPEDHPLAQKKSLTLASLKGQAFIGARDEDLPGHNRWITQLCRAAHFRPRILKDAESLSHGLSLTVTENAVSLMPAFVEETNAPGIVYRPLADKRANWDLCLVWQRGKPNQALKALVALISERAPVLP